ncbi:hypothetical protein PHYPSEUDO_015536 [Phytophthora pseudosyringae]|uniref:Uncharacterized protein n=1 Tax=Phytophthora pseudosyringae TaxID=221518 RepID=A0A8T1W000_9STRA|nr:hypothetical protein PHYPSEUDO_015536 [Phytophthora pseudosyringae]
MDLAEQSVTVNSGVAFEETFVPVLSAAIQGLIPGGYLVVVDSQGHLKAFKCATLFQCVGFECLVTPWVQGDYFVCVGVSLQLDSSFNYRPTSFQKQKCS